MAQLTETKDKDAKKPAKDAKDAKKAAVAEEELSEEDQQLKSDLDMLVERLVGPQADLYASALESMKKFIRESTSSMTAVPKPLKFLRPHYPSLAQLWSKWTDAQLQHQLADILSILGMTYSEEDGTEYKRECLHWRLRSNIDASIGDWGHEYLRHLSLEIGEAYGEILDGAKEGEEEGALQEQTAPLVKLSMIIVEYFLKHNAETEAVDLLLEVEQIQKLPEYVDGETYERVCNYMVACVPLLAPPDDLAFLNTAYTIYLNNNQLTQALTLAIRLDNEALIKEVLGSTDDELVQQQLGFMLGRQNSCFHVDESKEELQKCISNVKLSEYYKYLVGELNLLTPKVPEDVYKSHLENNSYSPSRLESAKQNLAAAFVSGFLNAGYGTEKLLGAEKWIYKTKDEGMLSTTASLGLVNLWDVDGLQALDKYLASDQPNIKAGALLGMGVATASVHDEVDAALLVLQDYLSPETKQDSCLTTAAITGLGIAFAGSQNEEVLNLLTPLVSEPSVSLEIQSLAALALGHVFVGTCHGDITSTILQALLETSHADLNSKWIRFMSLGLGLLYMGKYDQVEDVLETIDAIEQPIVKTLKVLVSICSYAGTGNVLQIQELLQMCTVKQKQSLDEDDEEYENAMEEDDGEEEEGATSVPGGVPATTTGATTAHSDDSDNIAAEEDETSDVKETEDDTKEPEEEDDTYQGYCVLGLALIAMGEEIGQEMSLRHFDHLMHYGTPLIKRAVPLAMGLVSASNPQMSVYDTLSRYSHDQDIDVAYNAIFAMGLVGAGTNNARLAQLLRQLASYYINDQNGLFVTRIAQGLVHLGKGTLTLSPFTAERQTLSKVGLASLLTVAITLMDPTAFVLSDHSSLLYYVTPAIKPRELVTVDTELKPLKVNVRVGQAVDVVGQAGKPKTITGWVTHSTPVLLGYGERAEMETDEYLPIASSLEGVVILRKNPDYMEVE